MKSIGVWLPEPVFSHGQLYVGGSRVGAPQRLLFAIAPEDPTRPNFTRNIVYREVFTRGVHHGAVASQEEEEDIVCLPDDQADYEGPYDGEDEGGVEAEPDMDMSTARPQRYNLRPRASRSCAPAKRESPMPKTAPR